MAARQLRADRAITKAMQYEHTQSGPLGLILLVVAAVMLAAAWVLRNQQTAAMIFLVVAILVLIPALAFQQLTIRDEGEHLAVRYGPLPLFRTRIPYIDIKEVEPDRTSLIDGWGIHYLPGRGWTYNLWGFDCVRLTVGRRTVRLGTDDRENLLEFLHRKTSEYQHSA